MCELTRALRARTGERVLQGTIKTTWKVWTYEVWGNRDDGWDVNDRFPLHSNYGIEIQPTLLNPGTDREFVCVCLNDRQLRNALGLKPGWPLEVEGDDLNYYVNCGRTGCPLGELSCTSHVSLSPVRETK